MKRYCHSSGPKCMGTFTLLDYPLGYFQYKYQVRGRRSLIVNVCPQCEADILERMPSTQCERCYVRDLHREKHIILLRTGEMDPLLHRRRAEYLRKEYEKLKEDFKTKADVVVVPMGGRVSPEDASEEVREARRRFEEMCREGDGDDIAEAEV